MNPEEVTLGDGAFRPDMISATWPTSALFLLALALLAAWVASHVAARRLGGAWMIELPMLLGRMVLGTVCLWTICSLASRITSFEFATNWSLWFIAAMSAICLEIVLSLYMLERKIVSRKVGLTLFSLRVALVLLLGFMLAQPVLTSILSQIEGRIVAILVDDSASMDVVDTQLSESEKLRLVELLDPKLAKRPHALDDATDRLRPILAKLQAESAALVPLRALEQQAALTQSRTRGAKLSELIADARDAIQKPSGDIRELLDGDLKLSDSTREGLKGVLARLDAESKPSLEAVAKNAKELSTTEPANLPAVLNRLDRSLNDLNEKLVIVINELPAAVTLVDADYFASLPDYVRNQIDEITGQSRAAIAKAVLLGNEKVGQGLAAKIRDDYEVRIYRFASEAAQVDADAWTKSDLKDLAQLPTAQVGDLKPEPNQDASTQGAATSNRGADPLRLGTDMRAAMKFVAAASPAKSLGGVIIVGDGHHNAPESPEVVARQFAAEGVPVSTVAVGSRRSPIDVAVVSLDGPRTVLSEDRVDVKAKIQVAGLKGQQIRVKLIETGAAIDSNQQPAPGGDDSQDSASSEAPLDEKIISVASDPFEAEVLLSATPDELRMHNYVVIAEPVDEEAAKLDIVADNNRRTTRISVTDERIKVLIVEARPRYEFRYLRNLLAGRDKTVKLQSLLLQPDEIAEIPPADAVHASVSRPAKDTEATLPPENEQEWMKFDLIVLGDVSPAQLGEGSDEMLRKFVEQRGGTLVVIAGPNFMPHAYTETELAELLPIVVEPVDGALLHGPEPSFAVSLTTVGRDDPITRQSTEGDDNVAFWDNLPPLYWRHPVLDVKPGAKVLAYATTPEQETEFQRIEENNEATIEDLLELRRAQERKNALIVTQNVGSGKVLCMATDRTWRLRYRTGDRYHHRLWGQILRWGQPEKLQAGTDLVRLGTSQTSYGQDDPVVVKARIVDEEFSPIEDEEAAVHVYQGSELVLSHKLSFLPDSGGRYEATLGELPGDGGEYRIELYSPLAQPLIEKENVLKVETVIDVQSRAATSRELVELTTDRNLLAKLAADGGGRFVEINRTGELLATFRQPINDEVEQERFRIWDSWPLLLLMVGVVTAEWTLRKKVGLA